MSTKSLNFLIPYLQVHKLLNFLICIDLYIVLFEQTNCQTYLCFFAMLFYKINSNENAGFIYKLDLFKLIFQQILNFVPLYNFLTYFVSFNQLLFLSYRAKIYFLAIL